MSKEKIFVPHELKTIEVDVEKKIFRVNGEDFIGKNCTGFSLTCSSGRSHEDWFDINIRNDTYVEYANYNICGEKTKDGVYQVKFDICKKSEEKKRPERAKKERLIPEGSFKTLEIDVKHKVMRINGRDFSRGTTSFQLYCDASKKPDEWFKISMGIDTKVVYSANYDIDGNVTSEQERQLKD